MKKLTLFLVTIALLLTLQPLQSNAANTSSSIAISKSAEANVLLQRLNEIKTMDKSNLKYSDKKNLRTEVILIREQLKKLDGGIYLSVGAIIIILLIILILL